MGIITLIYTKKMQKMMLFRGLPCVLQDLVMRYAYNMPVDAVRKEVRRILEVKHMGLPFFLFRTKVWSWEFSCFLPSPLRVFTPIARYGGYYGDLVDEERSDRTRLGTIADVRQEVRQGAPESEDQVVFAKEGGRVATLSVRLCPGESQAERQPGRELRDPHHHRCRYRYRWTR